MLEREEGFSRRCTSDLAKIRPERLVALLDMICVNGDTNVLLSLFSFLIMISFYVTSLFSLFAFWFYSPVLSRPCLLRFAMS